MPEGLYAEAHSYFSEKTVLQQLGLAFCEKYRSLDHWGGIVVLENLPLEKKQELSAFLREDVTKKEPVRIRYTSFAAAWGKTRFSALPLEEFLMRLYPGRLETKRESAEALAAARQEILDGLLQKHPSDWSNRWLQALQKQELRLAHPEFYGNAQLLALLADALDALPVSYERLPFFANRVTGNPHALDWDTDAGKIFLQALSYLSGGAAHDSVEEKSDLLYAYHLLRDDILNFATAVGLRAWKGSEEFMYWNMAAQAIAPLNLPFREIVRADRIMPYQDGASGSFVYIVENSGVYSTLLDALQRQKKPGTLLCLHGQLKTASWALLDRLAKGGAVFWYSGDFDPEGLLIAQRLRQRYENVQLWHFSAVEYQRTQIPLPANRLKRLQGICDLELKPIVMKMQEWKCAYYQESFADLLLKDL